MLPSNSARHFSSLILRLLCISLVAILSCSFQETLAHITFPVYHRTTLEQKHIVARQALGLEYGIMSQTNSSNQTHEPSDSRSELIDINGKSFGEYFSFLQLGTPAREITMIIDSASGFSWVQCEPCLHCAPQIRDPIFDPATSSSYQPIACDVANHNQCPVGSSVPTFCGSDNATCSYEAVYVDGSASIGRLSRETLTLPSSTGSTLQLKGFVFGCGFNNTGPVPALNSSGLMGLDRGNFSITSQFGVNIFSYCLPMHLSNIQASGYLTFGRRSTGATPKLQYTPLLQNNQFAPFSEFYYVNMTGISVNGMLLDIPSSAFEILISGSGGTILSSATYFTYFLHNTYTIVAQAFEGAMDPSVRKANVTSALCYELPITQQQAPHAPNITLHLAGPVHIHLNTDHVLVHIGADVSYNYYCMAFLDSASPDIPFNIIGNFQQQDFLVEYDVGNSRVGFAPTECSRGSP